MEILEIIPFVAKWTGYLVWIFGLWRTFFILVKLTKKNYHLVMKDPIDIRKEDGK